MTLSDPGSAASASPENLLQMQGLRPQPRPSEPEAQGAVGSNSCNIHSSGRTTNLVQCLPHIHVHHLEGDLVKMQILVQEVWVGPRVCISNKLKNTADGVRGPHFEKKSWSPPGEEGTAKSLHVTGFPIKPAFIARWKKSLHRVPGWDTM